MKTPLSNLKKIAITSGDPDGIGFEVTAKALIQKPLSLKKTRSLFILFRHHTQSKTQKKYFDLLDKHCSRFTFQSLKESLAFIENLKNVFQVPDDILIDLSLSTNSAEWVLEAAQACKAGILDSLITGPISKSATQTLPNKPVGHTGIFRQLFPKQPMNMAFVGKDFNVLLATDHIALSNVEESLKKGEFKNSLKNAEAFKKLVKSKKKIGVLGLNPHAGEKGILGSAENSLFKNLNSKVFEGPLVPDAAFLKKNWNRYCVFLCLYHDQGLIPFKSHHGQDSGVHITVGLPFVRTSVDHGTAREIFNKNVANPSSMRDAIDLNLKLTGASNV
ncbi:MAG: pyridoxal phosphate biosynthetic protein [Pseudobdellovibrio sp.]|jgi:4-hydroxythreonine-4-phosphate dehydrogenase|nr:pyridoxal phosphate biosynthetic protein [Pseudobdellovibrio sp.]